MAHKKLQKNSFFFAMAVSQKRMDEHSGMKLKEISLGVSSLVEFRSIDRKI
ncbi:MAG: hypothetical protein ABDH29_03020 [Aquificaceae bacterium]